MSAHQFKNSLSLNVFCLDVVKILTVSYMIQIRDVLMGRIERKVEYEAEKYSLRCRKWYSSKAHHQYSKLCYFGTYARKQEYI